MNPSMRMSLQAGELARYLAAQINAVFPDPQPVSARAMDGVLASALPRLESCFAHIRNKYFRDEAGARFSHLNGDQYAMLLYMAARAAWLGDAGAGLASKLYLLNKTLHGIDAFYEVELPSVFMFVHPVGTVLGRARYSDYLLVYQRCSVGSNHDVYPTLGECVTLRPGSSVLGNCNVGRNCTIAADSLLLDRSVPDGIVYIGGPRDFVERASDAPPTCWLKPGDS